MRLILDTHILLALVGRTLRQRSPVIDQALSEPDVDAAASVASLWEIAIKTRLGKLDPGIAIHHLPAFFETIGLTLVPITAAHALAWVEPPSTRDPFDRMLLAQCKVEGRFLATLDRALADHSLTARFG